MTSHLKDNDESARLGLMANALVAAARATRQRRGLVLAGTPSWSLQAAQQILANTVFKHVLWITTKAPPDAQSLPGRQAHKVLGRETDALVFDAHSGFDPDAFGAVTGCLRGGGLLLLLTPPLPDWPRFDDPEHARITVAPYGPDAVTGRFLARLARILRSAEGVAVIEQSAKPTLVLEASLPAPASPPTADLWQTDDQTEAVAAIVRVATGRRRRPVVLTSDRGRGKSAAFGIAAAQLLERGYRHILVTGPRLAAVEPLFEHARQRLPRAVVSRGLLQLGEARIEFAPPDELTLAPRPTELLLVDEAAAIPTPLLERLLAGYARIAFATTVHGYEGSGRGFALRFYRVLDQRAAGWKLLRLVTPIRWASGDPIERFVFRALLLDAVPAPDEAAACAVAENCTIEKLDRNRLAEDETTLGELFGLLVLAHYRTRPYDLRHLLDGPNLAVYAMRHAGHIVATALIAEEGGLDTGLGHEIFAGRRRLQGHLIPQSLAAHAGLEEAVEFTGARVMRIAVHPAAQGRGLGTRLLGAVVKDARANGLDWVGSSFGSSGTLLRFWQRSGWQPVRLGLTREASSGAHSVLVLQPLSARAEALFREARERFAESLPQLLADPLRNLDPELAAALLRGADRPRYDAISERDWRELETVAFAARGYEVSLAAIYKLVCAALTDVGGSDLINAQERMLLVARVLQKRGWGEVAAMLGMAGREQVLVSLRRALRPLVRAHGPSHT